MEIEEALRLGEGIAGYWGHRVPSLREDIAQEVACKIVSALDFYKGHATPALIKACARNAAISCLGQMTTVRIPRRSFRRMQHLVEEVDEETEVTRNIYEYVPYDDCLAPTDYDLTESIKEVCKTPEEERIIRLSLEGYKRHEIATLIGCSPSALTRKLTKIGDRYYV